MRRLIDVETMACVYWVLRIGVSLLIGDESTGLREDLDLCKQIFSMKNEKHNPV